MRLKRMNAEASGLRQVPIRLSGEERRRLKLYVVERNQTVNSLIRDRLRDIIGREPGRAAGAKT